LKLYCAYFHHNSFFVSAETNQDFWILLSKSLGWGKFVRMREQSGFATGSASLFELRELRLASEPAPYPIVSGSNVLWHLQEACEVLKRHSLSPTH
jgi:hypothetical protein